VAGAAQAAEAEAVRPREVVEALAVLAAQRAAAGLTEARAEVAARQPTAAPMKLAAAELMEEMVVWLPIAAGPFAESTFSPSYSSTQ
jgi:hypothetical protein